MDEYELIIDPLKTFEHFLLGQATVLPKKIKL